LEPPREDPSAELPKDLRTEILVERARSGCNSAWTLIYERYRAMLVAHLRSELLVSVARIPDIEALLQDSFVKAWERLPTYQARGERGFRRWIQAIVLNEARNGIKRVRLHAQPLAKEALARVQDQTERRRREREEERDHLLHRIGQLGEDDRELLIMKFEEGLSFERMAEILEGATETAMIRYSAALGRLKTLLGQDAP
jgi:RNA polymerase sigma-70 factor (ECF subfamily)